MNMPPVSLLMTSLRLPLTPLLTILPMLSLLRPLLSKLQMLPPLKPMPMLTVLPLLWMQLPSAVAWQTSAPLGRVGQLSWTSDVGKGVIMFEICVETDGWLGLGLSPTGTMAGADLAIGWFDQQGKPHAKDCWAAENGAPSIDQKQNWQLHTARRNESHTMLRFRRRIYTGDSSDVYITGQPMHVIYAWRDRSPLDSEAPLSIGRLQYHGREGRGVVTLCLLHANCFPPAGGGSNPTDSRVFFMSAALVAVVALGGG